MSGQIFTGQNLKCATYVKKQNNLSKPKEDNKI